MRVLRCVLATALLLSLPVWAADPAPSTLRFRIPSDPATLDWTLAHTSAETYVIMNLMQGLVESGPESDPKPGLAESWTISPDGKTYTFKLKKGVKWSDGAELEASQFVASWMRLLDPGTKATYASFLYGVLNAEKFHDGKIKDPSAVGIRATSKDTLVVTLDRVVPYFIHVPTFWVTFPIRPDLIKKFGKAWTQPRNLVTLGPYTLESWAPGKKIVLKRNPFYSTVETFNEDRPSRVEVSVITSDEKARESFYSGEQDFFLNATTTDLLRLRTHGAADQYRIDLFTYLATYYLGFNARSGPMRDANFRKAVALALDLKDFPAALQGGQVEAQGWIPPGVAGARSGNVLRGSLYEARAALARAGYGEGVGLPKLRLRVPRTDGADTIVEVVTKSLRDKLGITVEAQVESNADFQKTLRAGTTDLFVTVWGLDFPDPANSMGVFVSDSGTNYTGWSNSAYDATVREASTTLDLDKRLAMYSKAERLLLEDEVVIVPLFHRKNTVVLGPRISKFHISPLNYLFLKQVRLK